jgi:hypothetical protein
MATESDFNFRWVLPPEYHDGTEFKEGRAWVQKTEKGPWTLIDEDGNVLRDGFEARSIKPYREGVAYFDRGNFPLGTYENGYIDRSGDILLNLKQEFISPHYGNHMSPEKGDNGLWGYVNIFTREWEIQRIYEDPWDFEEGIARVRKDGKYGYIDINGNNITEFVFDDALYFRSGVTIVKIGTKYGLLNSEGTLVVEPIYEGYYRPWSNLIGFHKDGKVGFVDTKGRTVIDFKFYSNPIHGKIEVFPDRISTYKVPLYSFNNGRAIVLDLDTEKHWDINEIGDLLFSIEFGENAPHYFRGGFIMIKYGEEIILYDVNGKRLNITSYLSPHSEVYLSDDGPFMVINEKESKTGYFTLSLRDGGYENGR